MSTSTSKSKNSIEMNPSPDDIDTFSSFRKFHVFRFNIHIDPWAKENDIITYYNKSYGLFFLRYYIRAWGLQIQNYLN